MKTSKASLLFITFFVFTSFTVIKNSYLNYPLTDNSIPLTNEIVYCTPTVVPWNDWIMDFSFGNITNISDKTPHDFTSLTTDVSQGQSYPVSVEYRIKDWNASNPDIILKVWIDFNGDEVFQEPAETALIDTRPLNPGDNTYLITGDLTIPANAVIGSTRLRVFLKRGTVLGSCDTDAQGEYEDYTVNIIQGNNNGDTTPPIPTLSTTSNTVSGPFEVDLVFDENINGLTTNDFDITNGTISNLSGTGSTFDFNVNPTSEGEVIIYLPANRVTDDAGNGNVLSNTLNVQYDANTPPPPPPPTGSGVWSLNGTNIFYDSGIVGINMNATAYDTDYKLMVNGDVKARKVKVTPEGWADFVFEDDYNLMPLKNVEKYIKENKHLPNIPSEKEVLKNGIYLGETNKILLQKIEELTLYIIDLEKRLEKNEAEMVNLLKK